MASVLAGALGLWGLGRVLNGLGWGGRKPWFAFGPYMGAFDTNNREVDPLYFDPKSFPWTSTIEANWTVLKEELDEYLRLHNDTLVPYFNDQLISQRHCWRVIGLKFWNIDNTALQTFFPRTLSLFSNVPGLISLSFSQLQPGGVINPHNGDTNAHMRCHLGIKIPGRLPQCGFKVGEQAKSWEEGRLLMFCDAQYHTAFNNTDSTRFLCIFDVIRPEYASQQNWICARVLAALVMQKLQQLWPVIRTEVIRYPLYTILQYVLYIPVMTKLGSAQIYQILAP